MMGSRGKYNGYESEAFDRRYRRFYVWSRGELKRFKRAFARRQRQAAKISLSKGADPSADRPPATLTGCWTGRTTIHSRLT
jgi:hypothetical protein